MKKFAVLLALILLVAGLTGCQKEEKANETAPAFTNYRISGEDLEKLTIGGEMDFSLESLESES